jgi:predicted nucleotidyltransferase
MSNKIIIEDDVLSEIKDILRGVLPVGAKVYVFGSRATGIRVKPYSDVDLALDKGGEVMPSEIMSSLRMKFEFSSLPYRVDIIDLNAITDNFRNIIQNDLIELSL